MLIINYYIPVLVFCCRKTGPVAKPSKLLRHTNFPNGNLILSGHYDTSPSPHWSVCARVCVFVCVCVCFSVCELCRPETFSAGLNGHTTTCLHSASHALSNQTQHRFPLKRSTLISTTLSEACRPSGMLGEVRRLLLQPRASALQPPSPLGLEHNRAEPVSVFT